ncbi:thiamine ABC transporter substrate binding subunit [Rhodospirillaceae bacterium SYSU D60014]|uniref:thiamine ABC transporter substrate binding subunit n=1 Tax=Virgifigura deserti TaxID=2268457 RepID=UPI000E66A87D
MRHTLALTVGLLCAGLAAPAWGQTPTLTVYTYSSFTAEWGPGPAIEKAFEAECDCQLDYVSLEDGVTLLSRLQLEGVNTKADVVLGLDMNLMAEATATDLFAPHEAGLSHLTLPVEWTDDLFIPFDYGYFAFVYDKTRLAEPPESLDELVNGDAEEKILIQDPRTSTPGLGLLLWMKKVYGDEADAAWRKLQPRILTVSKGWSESYGLFMEGEAPMVLSYTTSPAYHQIAEEDDRFAAASFTEGHYLQIEVAGRVATSDNAELAQKFLDFVVSPGFQSTIPTGNWMYPVIALEDGLPPAFDTLVKPEEALLFTPEEVAANRKRWIDEWLAAMSQ